MEQIINKKYAFIGGGIMARIFIERLINSASVGAENIMVSDVKPELLEELKKSFGVHTTPDNLNCAGFADVIILAVPPSQVKIVLSEDCREIINKHLIISLAASIPTWVIECILCRETPVIRVIPNIPSLIGMGMNPYAAGKYATEDNLLFIEAFLSTFGMSIRVDENKMNLITALSAVGPTYFFPAIKALKDISISKGLSEEEAHLIISQTISGTAGLVNQTRKDPEELKLLIGTRTIDEQIVKDVFAKGFREAFSKIEYATERLTG